MNRLVTLTLTVALGCLVVAVPTDNVLAQQKQQLSFKTSAENTKYTQQHLIDVGDVPGHQVRVYELHCTFPNNAPVMNGVAIKEQWTSRHFRLHRQQWPWHHLRRVRTRKWR